MVVRDFDNHDYVEKVNVAKSEMLFLNYGDDLTKLVSILNIKRKYPGGNITVILDGDELKEIFQSAGATHVFLRDELISKLIAS